MKIWNKKLEEVFVKLGIMASIQPCLYHIHDNQGNLLILLVWVDDIFTFSFGADKLEQNIISKLKEEFKVSDKGECIYGLGMGVIQSTDAQTIQLSHCHYIIYLYNKYKNNIDNLILCISDEAF